MVRIVLESIVGSVGNVVGRLMSELWGVCGRDCLEGYRWEVLGLWWGVSGGEYVGEYSGKCRGNIKLYWHDTKMFYILPKRCKK